MFSKALALLLFAASAIAGQIEPGDYKISNGDYAGTVCAYNAGGLVYVCPQDRAPYNIVSL